MRLIDLLHQRRQIAEKFTKDFQDRVEADVKLYKSDTSNLLDSLNIDLAGSIDRRYQFNIPLIFTNHESMMSSMFDRVPELIFNQKGQDDALKEQKVVAAYEYLKDKLDLESFMNDTAWWYILSGFASAHVGYIQKAVDKPRLMDTGEPELDEMGKPKTFTDYAYDDPTLEVGDPKKEVYSPESEFKIDCSTVPYSIRWKMMTPSEIKRIYNKVVDPDSVVEAATDLKESTKTDVDRTKTYFYEGTLPEEVSGEIKGWNPDTDYQIIFTLKEVLNKTEMQLGQKQTRIIKWHGAPNEFFGFGLGKLLKSFQKEKNIRRGQIVRYADACAFAKLLLPAGTTIDKKTQRDPRENLVLIYDGEKAPEFISPPPMNQAVADANNLADQDAQMTTGLMDISTGAQQAKTVDTATGQSIFADAAEKRVRYAKKKYLKFVREVVILLLKMAQANWKSDKLIYITDDDGKSQQVSVNSQDLSDVDFDTDVDIDVESVSINKDVLREQAIAMYDKAKDDPMANRKELLKDAMQNGFGKKDPEKYISEPVAPPGTQLVDPMSQQQYVVDESGNLTTPETMQNLSQPSGEQTVTSQPGLMGGAM